MRVLITGGRGQLAKAFQKLLAAKSIDFVALSREELDITSLAAVLSRVRGERPQVIINCAAYNLVDQAEEEFPVAFSVNTLGPQYLALAAEEVGAFLIHFSTDYVFDGQKGLPYIEEDKPSPLSRYGLSKWLGELAVVKAAKDFLIFRVSWLFGEGKQNFLAKVRGWAEKNDTLRLAYDEFSVPTYTETVAKVAWQAYEKGLTGLYHLVSRGYASRLEWAKRFLEKIGLRRKIVPVSAASFGLLAKRPFFSALDPGKIERDLGIELPHWKEDLKRFCQKYYAS